MQKMFRNVTISSECVTNCHPDKMADRIADAILDEYLYRDENTRTGIEVMVKDNVVVLGGEVHSNAVVDCDDIVKHLYKHHFKFPENHHLQPENLKIINLIGRQSQEIHDGVDKEDGEIGAGDQGFVVGFATNETPTYMPLGHYFASQICRWIEQQATIGPDAKSQVVVEYDGEGNGSIKHILVSVMNPENTLDEIRDYIKRHITNGDMFENKGMYEKYIKDKKFEILVNPCGDWKIGGPVSDCGVTGRKIVVDQYGGYCNVGGGAFSGKDLSKVDRSGAYAARYIAKSIVAAGIADVAKVEMTYVIGEPEPVSINVVLDSNEDKISEIKEIILKHFPTRVSSIIKAFRRVNHWFRRLSDASHFGYETKDKYVSYYCYPWENEKRGKKYFEELANNIQNKE